MDFKEFAEVMQKVQNGEIRLARCPLCDENINLGYDENGGWYVRCRREGCITSDDPKRKFPSAEEASSTQLPVSEVCRQCHQFSKWCQAVPKNHSYTVTLYLREGPHGRYVSTNPFQFGVKTLATKIQMVDFEVPE